MRFPAVFLLTVVNLSSCGLSDDKVDFEKEIRPILENHCWDCHSADNAESGLRLDHRPTMLVGGDSGVPTVVPGQPKKSYLLEVVNHVDEDMAMPPDGEKLSATQIDLLKSWIVQGAVWPGQMDAVLKKKTDHWAFLPVDRPPLPDDVVGIAEVSTADVVDSFLRQKLDENELQFSESADAVSLIRRASIVLTGLAPTPEQTEQFVTRFETDPDQAYQKLVDRLMESPHFGERWAQHWLDVIRWAETNGSEANLYRKNAWIYRDYVVRAFNDDVPYSRFVQEQIAGDSLGAGEATGFLVAGPHVPAATVGREPAAIRQARADRMDEIMQTVGASVMGLTMGCARCHNHKFDPISIKDYYSMTGVFQDVEFGSRLPEYSESHPRRMAGEQISAQVVALRKELIQFGGWSENWGAFREIHFRPVTAKSIRFRFRMPNVTLDELELFGPREPEINLASRERRVQLSGFPEKGIENRNPIDRINDGDYGTMTWRAKVKKESPKKPWVRFDFERPETINRVRLSSNREYFYGTDYLDRKPWLPNYEFDLQILDESGQWKTWLGTGHINKVLAKKHPQRGKLIKQLQGHISAISEQGPLPSFIGRFIPPAVTKILLRGSPESPRDEVDPAGPEIFEGDLALDSSSPGPVRRAKFAQWIIDKKNPLTARVMVNRIWHHVFGRGIVVTTSDFGKAGAKPTHPELLDWLAAEFVSPTVSNADPWSMKAMIKALVLSKAFRQASSPTAHGLARDGDSALLWRFPPKRVEAEVIRDSILQASGSLDPTLGGRGYRIHNEKKTYAQWEVTNNYGPDTWRRMLYQERMRRVDDQMFTAFDFPDCGQVRAKRPVSTTPLQALNLMNSRFVIEQSKRIANRARQQSSENPETSVDQCFRLLLGRLPEPTERKICQKIAEKSGLETVCRALINSNEFAFLP